MSAYLPGLYYSAHLDGSQTSTHAVSDTKPCLPEDLVVAESASVVERGATSTEHGLATYSQQQLPGVELVSLLIVVAGLAREKSQFTLSTILIDLLKSPNQW